MAGKRNILLLVPSAIVARGVESVLADTGEFRVSLILSDLGRYNAQRLRNSDADAVIVDLSVFDCESRPNGRAVIGDFLDVPVVALQSGVADEETLRQYDASFSIMDAPSSIVRKLKAALEAEDENPRSEGDELSAREKEILICVAKGMINKEIADLYNISVYTVISHRKNIARKTGIKTVAGLTVYALLNNLIDMNTIE